MCFASSDSMRGISPKEMWTYEVLFSSFTQCATCLLSLSVLVKKNRNTPGRAQKMTTSWCSGCDPHELVENDSHVLSENDTLCCDMSYTHALISSQFSCWQACIFCDHIPSCQFGSANGIHFGSRLATRFIRRPTWRN